MLKKLFFIFFVKPFVLIAIGLNIKNRAGLPREGPAIIVANHNSHLDTLVLVSLFNIGLLPKIRPVAAADYFLKNKLLSFVALQLIGIIPLKRGKADRTLKDPFEESYQALSNGDILILFPEGSRGEPEKLSAFKNGVARLVNKNKNIPVIPVFLHGLGKALPRGEGFFVPFFCDIVVGKALKRGKSKKDFMDALNQSFTSLTVTQNFQSWE